ncbi:MAG: hypothetical protein OES47_03175 [Acidobacteriota bacterium]|nr:hypothetical protein [Acidobacteriota bacterium]
MKLVTLLATAMTLLFLIASPPPILAQSSAGETGEPLGEIAEALSRIADMLERQAQGSRLDLLMKRVDASNRKLERLDARLRTVQRDYAQARENLTRMEAELETVDERAVVDDVDPDDLRFQRRQIETEIELGRQRTISLGMSKAQLQNEIASRNHEVENWQAYVDRELSGLE